ncbi:hypothetical protein [Tenacibaculum amylolyticum]|uniref:hypothetical protein n=1 Tax=Tenacibaculum amylolyticum TaxID=104269 RepID=UPI003894291F
MKKILLFILTVGFITSGIAQKKRKGPDFSVDQKTELALKKMTLRLDLSERQQKKIRPLLAERFTNRTKKMQERKANKGERKKLTTDELYERQIVNLDRKIAFKANMREILNGKQYERFEKNAGRKAHKMKRKVKKRKKKHRHNRNEDGDMDMQRG